MLPRRLLVLLFLSFLILFTVSCEEDVTGPGGDETPPLVSSVFPLPDAVDVPVDAAMSVVFNEPMAAMSPAVLMGYVSLSHGTVTSATWTSADRINIGHTTWPENTLVTATFSAAFEDTAGNTLSGSYSYSFTTAGTSVTVPTVIMTHPSNGDDHVWRSEEVEIVFSEAMDPASASGNVSLSHGAITSYAWLQPHILEIEHDDWADNTAVTVTIGAGLTSAAGEGLAAAHVFSFTTDDNTVRLEQHMPADGMIDVPLNADVTLVFNREMDGVSLEAATSVTVPDKGAIAFDLQGEWQNWTLQFPVNLPASTVVTVTIGTGAQDLYGQALAEEAQFSFTTGLLVDLTPPQILSTSPADGATVPASTGLMQFTFDEAIDDFSLNPSLMSGQFAMNTWIADMQPEWNADFTVISVDLVTPLAAGTTFRLEFDSFADISGNVNVEGFVYEFTVEGAPDYFPVVDGQWFLYSGIGSQTDPSKIDEPFMSAEQIEVTGAPGDFLIKEWDDWAAAFRNWDMMTRNVSGVQFRGFHESDEAMPKDMDIMFSPVIEWMRFPVVAQSWSGMAMFSQAWPDGPDRVEYSVEYLGGTFDLLVEDPWSQLQSLASEEGPDSDLLWIGCRKALLHYELTDGVITYSEGNDVLWYAPGVGLVREETSELDGDGTLRQSDANLIWAGDHLPGGGGR